MERSTKAALTVVLVLGGFIFFCGGGGAIYWALTQNHAARGLPEPTVSTDIEGKIEPIVLEQSSGPVDAEAASPMVRIVPLRTNFASPEEAAAFLQAGDDGEKWRAAMYLESTPPVDKSRDKVTPALLAALENKIASNTAADALKKWARQTDAPAIRHQLEMLMRPPAADQRGAGTSLDNINARKTLIQLLAKFHDKDSAELIAQNLREFFLRRDVLDALAELGDAAEMPLLTHLGDAEMMFREAIQTLGKIGTQKSIPALQSIAESEHMLFADDANAAIESITARLKLTPKESKTTQPAE